MALTLKHQTKPQFLARLKSRLDEAVALAFLQNALEAGDFTEVECRQAFGQGVAEFASLKAKARQVRDAREVLRGVK